MIESEELELVKAIVQESRRIGRPQSPSLCVRWRPDAQHNRDQPAAVPCRCCRKVISRFVNEPGLDAIRTWILTKQQVPVALRDGRPSVPFQAVLFLWIGVAPARVELIEELREILQVPADEGGVLIGGC